MTQPRAQGPRAQGPEAQSSEVQRGGPQRIPRPSLWTPGRPAPWSELSSPESLVTPERIRSAFPVGRMGRESPVRSTGASEFAVLVPVYGEGSDMSVIVTRRADTLRTHRGEVSFPGGKAELGEVPVGTALREANEEIGLDVRAVEPLGELDHLTTVTRRAYIVPVVGLLTGEPSGPVNAAEVEKVLHVPVAELLQPGVFREEQWGTSEFSRPVYFFELYGDTIWGATAALLRQFLAIVTGTDPGTGADIDPAGDLSEMPHEYDPAAMGEIV